MKRRDDEEDDDDAQKNRAHTNRHTHQYARTYMPTTYEYVDVLRSARDAADVEQNVKNNTYSICIPTKSAESGWVRTSM